MDLDEDLERLGRINRARGEPETVYAAGLARVTSI